MHVCNTKPVILNKIKDLFMQNSIMIIISISIVLLILTSEFYSSFDYAKFSIAKDPESKVTTTDKVNNESLNIVFGQEANRILPSGISTGSLPVGIAVNPHANRIYVANQYSNTVSVYDTNTDKLIDTITVGTFPYSVDSNLFNDRIYVTNRGSNDVTVIDGSTNSIIDNITVGLSPIQVRVDPSNNWVYVANIDSNSVSVIDGITNKVINTIHGIHSPYGIGINPISEKIYVSNIANSTVTVLDKRISNNFTVLQNIDVGKAPSGIDIDTKRNLIFVTNFLSNSLSVINGTNDSLIKTIAVGKSPVGVKTNPLSGKAYVSNTESSSVSVINETNLNKIKNIQVNPSTFDGLENYPYVIPNNVAFPLIASFIGIDPVSNLIYVTNTASNSISLINGKLDDGIVKVSFNSRPENSGFVECNNVKSIDQNTTTFVKNNINSCKAIPERGYTFDSWSGLLNSNNNPLEFESSDYGNIIANFRPALSTEQYIFLTGGIMGMLSVLLGWFFKGSQRRKFNKLIQITNNTIEDADIGDRTESIIKLENLRRDIFNTYRRGSLTDFQFDFLDKRLLNYINKISNM